MRPSSTSSAILCLLCAAAFFATVNPVHADSSVPVVARRWFLTGSASQPSTLALSLSRPTGTTVETANINVTELEFLAPQIQANFPTISSPMTLSLWLNTTKSATLSLTGALHATLSGGSKLDLANYPVNETISPGLKLYNFTFYFQDQQFVPPTRLSVGIKVNTSQNPDVILFWGSLASPSFAVIRISGYESLSAANPQANPFQILGGIPQKPTTSFDLNSTYPDNIVFFQASVLSSFGYQDVRGVNLTVTDPFSRIVKWELMDLLPPSQQPALVYTASWPYHPNATAGTYQVSITIVDQQNATAFSFNEVATFGLSRQTILTRALNLIPYFGLGAGGLAVAAVAYRRNKTKKSYLVPFDFFNSLTGGELEGGSVVTVEGNTGSGKTIFTEQLMYEDLRKGRPCVFVSTGDFPSNVRSGMKSMGIDVSGYEQNGQLTFVDGYSSEAGQQSPEKFSIPTLADLTTVGMKISSSLPEESFKGGSLYLDSLTPLASKAKPESLVSFVQSLGARVKGMGGKAFFTVGPSVDGLVQKQLEEMADCVVQMEAFEEGGVRKSRLRIAKLRARRHQQGWVIYTIEEGRGIIFYSKKARS